MEILLVIVILGIMAAFAMPNYNKSVELAYEKDAVLQLTAIQAAEQSYYAREITYWPSTTSNYTVDQINTALHMNLIENGFSYSCTSPSPGNFTCTAQRIGGAFTLRLNVTAALSSTSPANPCCNAGSCPTVLAC